MNKKNIAAMALAVAVLSASAVYAGWGWGGHGMQFGPNVTTESVRKFQKDSLGLRDEMMVKELELQQEYSKANPDPDRIAAIKKEMIDLRAKIQKAADKHGITGGRMGSAMMGQGAAGQGSMTGMGCSCPMCGW
ncbi:hypothetical protein [Geobacter anodireducens]